MHADYSDLKQTINKHKMELKSELSNKIDSNTTQISHLVDENKVLRKENDTLKERLNQIEINQLSNNIIITGIQEGPYEPYDTTKLRIQEMIVATINSGYATADLATAKKVEITCCSRLGRF